MTIASSLLAMARFSSRGFFGLSNCMQFLETSIDGTSVASLIGVEASGIALFMFSYEIFRAKATKRLASNDRNTVETSNCTPLSSTLPLCFPVVAQSSPRSGIQNAKVLTCKRRCSAGARAFPAFLRRCAWLGFYTVAGHHGQFSS